MCFIGNWKLDFRDFIYHTGMWREEEANITIYILVHHQLRSAVFKIYLNFSSHSHSALFSRKTRTSRYDWEAGWLFLHQLKFYVQSFIGFLYPFIQIDIVRRYSHHHPNGSIHFLMNLEKILSFLFCVYFIYSWIKYISMRSIHSHFNPLHSRLW